MEQLFAEMYRQGVNITDVLIFMALPAYIRTEIAGTEQYRLKFQTFKNYVVLHASRPLIMKLADGLEHGAHRTNLARGSRSQHITARCLSTVTHTRTGSTRRVSGASSARGLSERINR
jgi:hypothetical protein